AVPSSSHELLADDRRLGVLTVHLGRSPSDEDEAFLSLAADRFALLAAEHGVTRAGHERAAELDYLSEATELLAGSLSVQLSRAQSLGVMVLGRADPLDAMTFMATLELARRAALAVDNARLHEEQAATATALQASLLPTALPDIEGVELAARYHSASPGMLV